MGRLRMVVIGILLILVLAAGGFLIWAYTPLGPQADAMEALLTDEGIRVQTDRWLVFQPAVMPPSPVGLIFYPGGRVDPRSYALEARQIAAQGYRVVIVPMPLNLAVLGAERATDVMDAFGDTAQWAIGGHSLGGAMAARYAYLHPDKVQGLVLWAAYPAESDGLSARDLAVVSIYGSQDGLATVEKVEAGRPLLPNSTHWVLIEGGNHAGFGSYGTQSGDGVATITQAEQRAQVVAATVSLLGELDREIR